MDNQLRAEIKVGCYDLDEETGNLRSDKEIADYMPIKKFTRLEAISPRWGTRLTNKLNPRRLIPIWISWTGDIKLREKISQEDIRNI